MDDKKINTAKELIQRSTGECSVYVGCDSKVFCQSGKNKVVKYHVTVWIHRNSKNGAYCVYKDFVTEPFYGNRSDINQRLLKEAELAAVVAAEIKQSVGNRTFQVHLDISSDDVNKSNQSYKAAEGYVYGIAGIKPNMKPDAPAASYACDRSVKNKMIWDKSNA